MGKAIKATADPAGVFWSRLTPINSTAREAQAPHSPETNASTATQAPAEAPVPPPMLPSTTTTPTPSGAPTTKLVGQGCCRPFTEILDARRDMTRTECMEVCMSRQACNAFAISGCSSSSDENCGGACHIYELDSAEEAHVQKCSETNGFLGITS